jgi:hypothetical protein
VKIIICIGLFFMVSCDPNFVKKIPDERVIVIQKNIPIYAFQKLHDLYCEEKKAEYRGKEVPKRSRCYILGDGEDVDLYLHFNDAPFFVLQHRGSVQNHISKLVELELACYLNHMQKRKSFDFINLQQLGECSVEQIDP